MQASSREDRVVVAPSGRAYVDWCRSELREEIGYNTKSTRARQSLGGSNATRAYIGMVPAKEHTPGTLVKLLIAINGRVLLVEVVIVANHLFSLAHNREHVWLAILRPVGTDA